jgi:8-oxo-dGTP pyrophosphatase MutT (NUDIX family)
MASSQYHESFSKQAKILLPDWMYKTIHHKAHSAAGGLRKGMPTRSNVHVNTPLGSKDDKINKDVPIEPDINNQGAKVLKADARRIATVAVRHGDHLLMGKRRDNGKWTVPGGHVDEGEDMIEGAKRELREETGIGDSEHMEELTDLHKGEDLEKKPLHVQAYQIKYDDKPSTSMLKDPDGEVERWKWVDVSNGLPEDIKNKLHVPAERNILMQALGLAEKTEVHGGGDNAMSGFYDMQQIVDGMDYEMSLGVTDPDVAKEFALACLESDPDYYKKLRAMEDNTSDQLEKEEKPDGLNLDLGSGHMREPGHLGIDLYPHDHGTIVHDLNTGIPFPDNTVSKVRAVNSIHEMGDDLKPILSEIQRVLMPNGQFVYEGPNEIYNYPDWLVQTDYESNEEEVQKIEGQPTFRQKFTRIATPDPATADDAEPRIGIAQYDMLPADALLAMDALGYYWSDATSSGRGNRLHGYPSQGALVKSEDGLFGKIKKLFNSVFNKKPVKGPTDNTTATSDDEVIAMSAFEQEIDKGGPGSGRAPEGGAQQQQQQGQSQQKDHPFGKVTVIGDKPRGFGKVHVLNKSSSNPKTVPIFKADNEKQLVYGVILSPDEVDSQEDWMQAEDIEKAAHSYLINSRVVGSQHTRPTNAEVVESYIAPQDFETTDGQYGPQKVKKGSWVLGVKVNDKAEWAKVKNGEYTGFSVGGFGLRDPSTSANV